MSLKTNNSQPILSSPFSSSISDSDQSTSYFDIKKALEKQTGKLVHAMLNEGDDDKDERPFYIKKKSRGRPKKRLKLEEENFTSSIKKRGRPRKNDKCKIENKKHTCKKNTKIQSRGIHSTYENIDDTESESDYENENQKDFRNNSDCDSNNSFENDIDNVQSNSECDDDKVESNSDSGIAEFETESETSDEICRPKKKIPRVRQKAVIGKAFTDVSMENIIRRRDVMARNPEAYRLKKVITRSNRRLDYKESSTEESPEDSDAESEELLNNKGNIKKKIRQTTTLKEKMTQDTTDKRRRRKNSSNVDASDLPIIFEKYKLSLMIENCIDTVRDTEKNENWCCDFEPHRPGQVQTDIAALAGSNNVFLLDTSQGRYIKKYIHSEKQEIFRCIAWTTLSIDNDDPDSSSDEDEETCNVLAAAGILGSIKLLNPLQNECYRYLFGHSDTVLRMVFSEYEPRWLFSASLDGTVRLWDIGSPVSAVDDSICLAKFILPSNIKAPSSLNISYDISTIIVGCSDGNLVHFQLAVDQLNCFRKTVIESKDEEPITVTPIEIYPAGNEWHEGYIDDIYILGQDGNEKSPLYNHVLSRGAEDMEIVVWDPKKSNPTDIEIYKSFQWPESFNNTGLRFKVVEKNGQKLLIAGDYDGNIHIFCIDDLRSETLSDNSKEVFYPTRIFSHETSNTLIRDVSLSSDTRSIIAIDFNNNTFVWRCAT